MHWQPLCNAGCPEIRTVAEPGVQGVLVAGMQGAGVNTPDAAEVAAITAGLVGALHMPKEAICENLGIASVNIAVR